MIVSHVIDLHYSELTNRQWEKLFRKLTFHDAKDREVKAYKLLKGGRVRLPRGAWSLLPDNVVVDDSRSEPKGRILHFTGTLDAQLKDKSFSGQAIATRQALDKEQGIVIAQPGWGKTNAALWILAHLGTPSIVFVHTEDIFQQWLQRIEDLVPEARVGQLQGSNWTHGDIDVAMVQTVVRDITRWRKIWAEKYGAIVIDECHHAPAASWEMILNNSPSRYRIGFSATATRADGLHPLMQKLIGPTIYKEKFESKVPVTVEPHQSDFYFAYRGPFDWANLQNALVKDDKRNRLIAELALREIKAGHSVLVLSRRIEHLERVMYLMDTLGDNTGNVQILTGSVPKPKRRSMLDKFRAGKIKCILATQLADEALDVPILSRVILTYPGKHEGRIIQQVGRALREHPLKEDALIIDIVDDNISVLRRQYEERLSAYKSMKIPVGKLKEPNRPKTAKERRQKVAAEARKRMRTARAKRQLRATRR